MEFKSEVTKYLTDHGVTVNQVEQEGENRSVVCHVPQADNIKIANLKDVMEKMLNVMVLQSNSFGMNVVVVEANDLDEEE